MYCCNDEQVVIWIDNSYVRRWEMMSMVRIFFICWQPQVMCVVKLAGYLRSHGVWWWPQAPTPTPTPIHPNTTTTTKHTHTHTHTHRVWKLWFFILIAGISGPTQSLCKAMGLLIYIIYKISIYIEWIIHILQLRSSWTSGILWPKYKMLTAYGEWQIKSECQLKIRHIYVLSNCNRRFLQS